MDGTYKEGEKWQEITIKTVFKVKHSPGDEKHLKVVLGEFLRRKGVEFDGENIII